MPLDEARGGATDRDAAAAGVCIRSGGVKGESERPAAFGGGEKRRQKLHDNFSSIDPEV